MKRIAIISAQGFGDGLIMLIASYSLRKIGYETVLYNQHLHSLKSWLPDDAIRTYPLDWPEELKSFDAVLVQHDNTLRSREIASLRSPDLAVYVFYTNYRLFKHGPLAEPRIFDYCFNEDKTMVDNVAEGISALFGRPFSKKTGLFPPKNLSHRRFSYRIALHPISGDPFRNWPKIKFLKLSNRLKKLGFDPFFLLTPDLKNEWSEENARFFHSLEDLAAFIYESGYFIGNNSGPGHLASCLSIPTLIFGHEERHMRLWRPGWLRGEILCPYRHIPRTWRKKYWKNFISTNRALKSFKSTFSIN